MIGPLAWSQTAPSIGYVFPPAASPGTTVHVHLGGYDWTPDLQFFCSDPRIQLEILGPPGPMLVPKPPYWFGAKARIGALPLPREVKAKIVVPDDIPAGRIHWQVANANGGSSAGQFYISGGHEVVEDAAAVGPQAIGDLPVAVSGQLFRFEDVDRYQFSTPDGGPVTCRLDTNVARPFDGILEIRDAITGQRLADAAGTDGRPPKLTFMSTPGTVYTVSVYDFDFRGNRSFVYRLHVRRGPRVLAAIPAGGRRGETTPIEFVGIGVSHGQLKLESVTRDVTFPADPSVDHFEYEVQTEFGSGQPFPLLVSDLAESVEDRVAGEGSQRLSVPCAVTGVLATKGEVDRFEFDAIKDQQWRLTVAARQIGTALDPILTVIGPDGKPVVENDDLPGTPDAGVDLTIPADGTYVIIVRELSGHSGDRAAVYRLAIEPLRAQPIDFSLETPANVNLVIGEKAELTVKASRQGGFDAPIEFSLSGLPPGVSPAGDLVMAADQSEIKLAIESSADAPATASIATITAKAVSGETKIERTSTPLLFCSIMKPRCKVMPVDKDGGRTVHAGTTYPAEVIIERLEGFQGEVRLEMASAQSRHRQGIRGPEIIVPPDVGRTYYPVFAPEWLETTRTSRMVCNAVALVRDPHGNQRYLVNRMDGSITMSIEGALLKISYDGEEIKVHPGDMLEIPLRVARSAKLKESVRVELCPEAELEGLLIAEPMVIETNNASIYLPVRTAVDSRLAGDVDLKIRATALQAGQYPVVSETTVRVVVVD